MAVPEEIRKVERPTNTIVLDHGGNGPYRYAVLERIGCRRKNGHNQPVTGGTVGHIIDMTFVPCEPRPVSMSDVELKSYGDVMLLDNLSKDLADHLLKVYDYKDAMRIYCLAILKVCHHGEPYKRMHKWYELSYLSELYPSLALSRNTICTFLDNLGRSYSRISTFMRNRVASMVQGQDMIIDGTLKSDDSRVNSLSHFSRKARIKGTKDITVVYAYGAGDREPVCSKVYGGNVVDSVSQEDFIKEMGLEYGIVLSDKGFPHAKVAAYYSARPNLHYISPIKRSDRRIARYNLHDYDVKLSDSRGRDLLAKKVLVDGTADAPAYWLYSFYDRARAAKRRDFGTIVFESDVDKDPAEIYKLYDERWLVEEFFHYYKAEDGLDDTRVHYDTSVIGSEFISFIASVMTARLVNRFDELGLFKENSYKDLMGDLAQAKKVKTGASDGWLYVQLPEGIQEELRLLGLMPEKDVKEKRKPGRPKKVVAEILPKRKPGRPRGSKNRSKADANA